MTRKRSKKPATPNWRILHGAAWQKAAPIAYEDWIAAAGAHPEQNDVWRFHEQEGRKRYQTDVTTIEHVDLGGEG